jgi:D-alanine-D-alanine ligase
VKFAHNSRVYKVTKSHVADDLDEETTQKLSETALAAYRAVKLRDYGRIDMRLTPEGDVYVIEANPNPWLSSKHEFAMAAKKSGRNYTQLIGEIVDIAIERTRPRSRSNGS